MEGSTQPITAHLLPHEQTARREAEELLLFADGVEDAGHPELARRSRVVARELLTTLDMLANERAARRHIQDARNRCLALLLNRPENGARIIHELIRDEVA